MKHMYASLSGLLLGAASIVALAAPMPPTATPPTMAPHGATALPPSASTRCPPGSSNAQPPDSRAPYAATGTHAMPRNPDSRLTPEEPMRPQVPASPCR
jgi:hypothetical protein